jgi:hypothetical protein
MSTNTARNTILNPNRMPAKKPFAPSMSKGILWLSKVVMNNFLAQA